MLSTFYLLFTPRFRLRPVPSHPAQPRPVPSCLGAPTPPNHVPSFSPPAGAQRFGPARPPGRCLPWQRPLQSLLAAAGSPHPRRSSRTATLIFPCPDEGSSNPPSVPRRCSGAGFVAVCDANVSVFLDPSRGILGHSRPREGCSGCQLGLPFPHPPLPHPFAPPGRALCYSWP